MAFGMSPFPLQFGTRGGGASVDPTAITPANADAFLASLGLTQAGTGTTWGETGQAATPLYAVAAAKVPLAVETIAGKKYFGPIVNPAGTNLALYSSDGTNAAWTKTNCTAALALGGLEHDAEWRGSELITNGTFDTDLTSWSNGNSHWSVVNGRAYHASSSSANLLAQAVTTAGKFYELTFDYDVIEGSANARSNGIIVATGLTGSGTHTVIIPGGGDTDFYRSASPSEFYIDNVSVREVDAHTLLTATADNATALQSITSTSGERVSKFWLARGSGSGAISLTQDNGSTWADVTLADDPQPFNVAAATLANPVIGIRIATSGDSVRLYGVQHQVAARALRPRIGPTAGSTVTTGARTMIETLAGSPTTVHLKLKLRTPTVSVSGQTVFSVDNNAATNLVDLKANGSGGFVLRKVIASSETAFSAFAVAVNTLIQIEVEISASVFRYRLDGGSWVTGTAGIPGSLSRFRIGHDNANTGQLGSPILALDEMSTAAMMTGDRGWNKAALA